MNLVLERKAAGTGQRSISRPRRAVGAVLVMGVCVMAACSSDDTGGAAATTAAEVSATTPAPTTASATTAAPSTAPAATTTATPTTVPAPAEEPEPVVVTGPISGGAGQHSAARRDLTAVGYTESEFFVEATATSYASVGELGSDGKWTVEPDATAEFRTRIIVRRPQADVFSGTVLVEWLNVSSGADGDPDWGYNSDEIIRSGHAWVGVSAQAVGVVGGGSILGEPDAGGGGLVNTDPARYGTLIHPGDAYSFDIYTHAARALTAPDGPPPLGDLDADVVVAIGESQSAFALTTYANAVHPLVGLFDGFLIHSRGAGGLLLDGTRNEALRDRSSAVAIRDDLDVPVLVFQTETDLTVLGYGHVDQPDSEMVKVWEVAGTAHADEFLLVEVYGLGADTDLSAIVNCPAPLNAGPHHETLQAALHHLVAWVIEGTEPPASPRLELASTDPLAVSRDELGIAVGGIRTPLVDVPMAVLSGEMVEGAEGFCALFGSTVPLDPATVAELYPTAQIYLDAFAESLEATVDAGFVLAADADRLTSAAKKRADTLLG